MEAIHSSDDSYNCDTDIGGGDGYGHVGIGGGISTGGGNNGIVFYFLHALPVLELCVGICQIMLPAKYFTPTNPFFVSLCL